MTKSTYTIFLDDRDTLWIGDKFWDSGAFRPDLKLFLKNGVKYNAKIKFNKENLQTGDVVTYPKKITISNPLKNFINIR